MIDSLIQILSTSIQQFLEKFDLVEIYNSLAVYCIAYCNLGNLGSRILDSQEKKPEPENVYNNGYSKFAFWFSNSYLDVEK